MTTTRRGFIAGLAALIAAPAIVRASSLMPIRTPKLIIPTPKFYSNRTIRVYMDITHIRTQNVLLETSGYPLAGSFREIPMRLIK